MKLASVISDRRCRNTATNSRSQWGRWMRPRFERGWFRISLLYYTISTCSRSHHFFATKETIWNYCKLQGQKLKIIAPNFALIKCGSKSGKKNSNPFLFNKFSSISSSPCQIYKGKFVTISCKSNPMNLFSKLIHITKPNRFYTQNQRTNWKKHCKCLPSRNETRVMVTLKGQRD